MCGKRILSSNNLSTLAFSGLIWLNIDLLTLSVLDKYSKIRKKSKQTKNCNCEKVTDAKLKKMMRFSVRFLC